MSIRHRPNVFNEPTMFAAIHVKGYEYGTTHSGRAGSRMEKIWCS